MSQTAGNGNEYAFPVGRCWMTLDCVEARVQDRIAKGETELAARDFVLSPRDSIGSRLYALSCDLTERVAYNRDAY